jgi:two-component system, NtrC family, sensor kinase
LFFTGLDFLIPSQFSKLPKITINSMGNYLLLLFTIPLIRKYLQTATNYPKWDGYLLTIRNYGWAIWLINSQMGDRFDPTFDLVWACVYLFIIYFLYQHRQIRIAKVLLTAAVPFVIGFIIYGLFSFWTPRFLEEYEDYFQIIVLFGVVWMIAFGIGAANQHKALLKEQKQREVEEEENRKVLARKDVLEVMVQERTAEIQQQKEEIERTLIELKETQNQLIQREKLASLGELTAGIAHEIQNPLNFVNNFSEVSVELIDELTEERKKEKGKRDEGLEDELLEDLIQNLQKINHHGKRASSIVRGMLEHSRTSSGEKQLTDINALADEYLRLSYHGLRAKDKTFNADFKTEFEENLPKAKALIQDLGRVFLNLINNAFYAVQKKNQMGIADYKPTVIVKTNQSDKHIEVRIIDNGTGMSDTTKAKIFQPFFTTKPTGEGTGLGLSLAYDIVTKAHGGSIEVESKEGEGTTFVVKLPVN